MSNKQIKLGAMFSYVIIFVNIVAGLLYTPWMINQIGKSDYGLYMLMTSVLTYFVVDYGLSQAVTRLISKYISEDKTVEINNLLGVTAKLYLVIDFIVLFSIILMYFFIEDIFVKLTIQEIIKFKQIYLIAGFFSVLSFPFLYISGVYSAYELFSQLKLFDLVSKFSSITLTVLALLSGYDLYVLVFVYAVVPFFVNLGKFFFLKHKGYLQINWRFWDNKVLKGVLNTSLWLLVIVIGELLLKNISPTILGVFSGTEEIAIFSIASTLDSYILVFGSALNGLFLPKISFLIKKENKEKLIGDLMIKVGRFQILIIGLFVLGLLLIGKDFIELWVGRTFSKSYYVLILMFIPTFFFSIIQLGTTYILALNKLKYQAYLYVLGSIFSVSLAILLTPKYGAIGSGISILISKMIFLIFGLVFVFHNKLRINMIRFFENIFSKIFIPLIIIVPLFLLFDYFSFQDVGYFSFIANSAFLVFIYGFTMFKFYLNKEDKEIVNGLFRRYIYRIK